MVVKVESYPLNRKLKILISNVKIKLIYILKLKIVVEYSFKVENW